MNDILVDISTDDLPKLALLYEKHVDWAPHVFAFIKSTIRWKKSQEYHDKVTLTSPDHSWEKDGTIIALVTMNSYYVFVFTLQESCENLSKGLQETTRIDFTKKLSFLCVHEKHISPIRTFLKNAYYINCTAYAIPPKVAQKFSHHTPGEVYFADLDPSHANKITSSYKFPLSEEYVSGWIQINGGVGLFFKENDQLVSWIFRHLFGHLAMLQTDENYKRRGYGEVVTKILSKRIAEEGLWPFGTVVVGNRASEALFEKLNFRRIFLCSYIILNDTVGKDH